MQEAITNQISFFIPDSEYCAPVCENTRYLTEQIITYLGNKRALLGFIGKAIEDVKHRVGQPYIRTADVFSGSGIVSRYLKQHSTFLYANDIEDYSFTTNLCYLANRAEIDIGFLRKKYDYLLARLDEGLSSGFISEMYSPQDDHDIKPGERVFYTSRNAKYIDTCRQLINELPPEVQHYFIAPLLSEASVKSNTSGVFKGFYKNSETSLGQFGGNNRDALSRILTDIKLEFPIFSNYSCKYEVCRVDANVLAQNMDAVDLAYLDPPYNQHPYGSNYFMLNLINDYRPPKEISRVSGIPIDWNRSNYNKKSMAKATFEDLVERIPSKYLLISYNSEGFISLSEMMAILQEIGTVELMETQYNTFRGSRNLRDRNIYIKEYLFLVTKERKSYES